jgi:hypothetical protein
MQAAKRQAMVRASLGQRLEHMRGLIGAET